MDPNQVMEGVKVADFSWVGVGPIVSRALAEHGATVIHVESHESPDPVRLGFPFKDGVPGINRSALAAGLNTNKFGMSLNLKKDKGKEAALRLIRWADMVTESYSPGTMAKFGLDYESVKQVKENIIYYSTTQHGQYGPLSNVPGYGFQGAAASGFCNLAGWRDREPIIVYGAYTDFIAPWYLLVALIGALIRLRRTGQGMYLDQSQCEAAIHFLEPAVLGYTINGRVLERNGNRLDFMAPHNAYPCKGKDRWIAIAVQTDEEWEKLCDAMDKPDLANDQRFATLQNRKKNEIELDAILGKLTSDYLAEELMILLQSYGIAAGVVQNSKGVLSDPQLKHRNHFVELKHSEIGDMVYRTAAYKLSWTPARLVRPGPCLGEHNEFVYKKILGYSDAEFEEMIVEGVITKEAVR